MRGYDGRLLVNKSLCNQGFTLVELVTVIVFVGIVGVIAAPSLLSLMQRMQLDRAVASVEGSLAEAQRTALRESIPCWVAIGGNTISTTCQRSGAPVVVSQDSLPPSVTVVTASPQIDWSFRGTTVLTGAASRISLSRGNQPMRCVEVTTIVGKVTSGTVSGGSCQI